MNLSSMPPPGVNMAESQALPIPVKTITGLAVAMCALSAIFYCYEYYLRVAPSVMSGELKAAFNLSEAAFGNLAACYYYAYTPMQLPVGIMMDKYGPRKILTFACFCCVLGTLLFAATQSILLAQIGRFLVGFGSAFAFVGVLKISNVWLPQKYFAFMAGFSTTLGMVGGMSGQLTMAYMVNNIGWQSTLYYSVFVGVALTAALWAILRDNVSINENNDNGNNGNNDNNDNIDNASMFSKAEIMQNELSHESIVKSTVQTSVLEGFLGMLKSRMMWINAIIGCLTYLPLCAFAEIWAVPFLESLGFSKPEAAMGASMLLLGFAVGSPCYGLLSEMMSSRRLPLAFGSFLSAICLSLAFILPSNSMLWMYSLMFGAGFFVGAEILVFAVSNDLNRKEVAATAAAFTNTVTMLGGVILPPLIGKLLDNAELKEGLIQATTKDYSSALIVIPIALCLAGILSLSLKETYKSYR